jgi:basic membrane protein A
VALVKQTLGFLAAALAVGLLSGCSSTPVSSTPTPVDYKVCLVSDQNGFSDHGLNQAAYFGLLQSEAQLGPMTSAVELSPSDSRYKATHAVQTLVNRNCSLIFAVGQVNVAGVRAAANRNPQLRFALLDAQLTDATGSELTMPNVVSVGFDETLAATQAGYLAASKTQNSMVGVIGDKNSNQTVATILAFRDGVKQFNAAHQAQVSVIGADSSDSSSWRLIGNVPAPARVEANVRDLLSSGASVVFGVNVSNLAVAKAVAKFPGTSMIGWNADLYLDPDFATYKAALLASIRKSASDELVAIAQSAMVGTFAPGLISNATDGTPLVGLTPEHEIPFGNGISSELQNLKPTL